MPSKKSKERIVLQYIGTDYVVKDLGENESPRFLLYDKKSKKQVKKSDNPLDFDEIVFEVLDE